MIKLKNYLALLLVAISTYMYAQLPAPAYVGSAKFSAKGSGTTGNPTINFTIPNGITNKNRIMVITMSGERYNASGNNFFVNNGANDIYDAIDVWDTYVNGNNATMVNGYHRNINGTTGLPTILQNWNAMAGYYKIPDNMTGTVPITFARLAIPQTANDEISFIISVYENVKSFQYIYSPFSIGSSSSATGLAAPVGRTVSEIMYMVNGGITQETDLSLSAGWTVDQANRVNNITTSAPSVATNEHDGIAHIVGHRNAITGNPTVTVSRTGTGSTFSNVVAFHALIPFASPSITGNVYKDTTGAATIEGTATNAGGTYINVIDSNNNLIYSATVSAAGVFTIPTGFVLEDSIYRLEISKNTGTIGATAPLKELPVGWGTVGESTAASPFPNDGANNGTINLTIGTTNITGLRYGINTCAAGVTAPPVQNISFVCPAKFVDLNTAHTGTIPAGASLVWFNNNAHTGTALSGTQVTQALAGTYYAFYYDSIGGCYSPTSTAAVVTGYNTLDSDGDGVPDVCDLDDDNDGILDTVENCEIPNFPVNSVGSTVANLNGSPNITKSGTVSITTANVSGTTNNTGTIAVTGNCAAATPDTGIIDINFSSPVINAAFQINGMEFGTEYVEIEVLPPFTGTPVLSYTNLFGNPVLTQISATKWRMTSGVNCGDGSLCSSGGTIEISGAYYSKIRVSGSSATNTTRCRNVAVNLSDAVVQGSCNADIDNDGIPNHLDLDSDNDGCLDAIEGDENVTPGMLVNSGGTITVGTGSTASNQNLCAGSSCVNANGVPALVNSGGGADVGGDQGQGVGDSQNGLINTQCSNVCYKPFTTGTPDGYTKVGITKVDNLPATGWPGNVPNGFLALASTNKGFVLTRTISASITNPVEGMLIYDTGSNCIKLYNGTAWNCITKSCNN